MAISLGIYPIFRPHLGYLGILEWSKNPPVILHSLVEAVQAMGLGRCSSGGEVGGHGPVRFSFFFLGTSGPLGLLGPLGPLGPGCFILVIPKASPMTDLLGSDDAPDSHLLSRNVSKWLII